MQVKKFIFFDTVYQNFLIFYLLQSLMRIGKKVIHEKFFFEALLLLKLKLKINPFLIVFEIIEKNKPILDIKFKKKKYKNKINLTVIPIYLNQYAQYKKILKWLKLNLIFLATKKKIVYKFFLEILNLYLFKENNFVFKKKYELYKYIIINKFNKHYRW